jgi:NADH pyrophosphatase NudC (nudix superfamily)
VNTTICPKCGYEIKKYNNIYGTFCRACGEFIYPIDSPSFIKKNEEKMIELRYIFRQMFKNKMKNKE